MKSKKTNDDEIIELTEVLEEDDQFDDQDMDKEFENFLTSDDHGTEEPDEQAGDSIETEVDGLDFESLFDQEEDRESPDHERISDERETEEDIDLQAIDTEEQSEGLEETAQLETLFADLDEQPQEPQTTDASATDRTQDLEKRLETLSQDFQALQHAMAAYPSAEALQQALLTGQPEPEAHALSREAEEALVQKACTRFEQSLDEKIQAMQQQFEQRLAQTEQTVQTLIAETVEQKIQSVQQESKDTFGQLSARIAEQDQNLRSEMHKLTEGLASQQDLNVVQSELQQEMQDRIQKAVPQAAAKIIREEIQKLAQE
jgi:hypothetical protein